MNASSLLVSIILPCYNAENVISLAIESVANNTIASKCELIIVNDGSTDNTEGAIDSKCRHIKDLKIDVIKTENQGVSRARNTALDVAKGKYIVFLDADDCISPCMLENMVDYSEKEKVDFSYCKLTSDITWLCKNVTVPENISKANVFSILLYRSSSLRFSNVLYRREIIEKNNLRFDETLSYGEDLEFLWKYVIRSSKCISFNKAFYYYARDNKASAMHQVSWKMTDVLKAVERISEYIPPNERSLRKLYDEYMFPRYILFLQKSFAAGNNKKLFLKLKRKYSSISYRTVIRKARFVIKVSAILYCISPSLYFHIFKKFG